MQRWNLLILLISRDNPSKEEVLPIKPDDKLKDTGAEQMKLSAQKRSFLSLHDFPSFYNPDMIQSKLLDRLRAIFGKKKNPNAEILESPILPFPRVG